ncbi:MAG: flagellar M-ring protein FliF, partial [Mariprofundaceae bacterium]
MADSLTPQQPLQLSPSAVDRQDAGHAHAAPGTVHIPSMLAKHRRLMLFAAGSLMLAGFIGLMLWSSEKPYRAVYAGMAEKDAASVVEILQKEHIPYRLEGSGTVMVPADQVYQARLKLAG